MKSCFLLMSLCLSALLFAQDLTFQLKDYKYRTPGFKALSVDLSLSGSHNEHDRTYSGKKNSSIYVAGPLLINYYTVKSTDKVWQQWNAAVSGYLYASNSTDSLNGPLYKYRRLENALNINWTRRVYRAKNWFFELGNNLQTSLSNTQYKSPAAYPKDNRFTAADNFTLGIGKGRVEWVQDAQMALYILHDLSAQGLLDKTPTPETAKAFAQLITDINNKRVFDLRRRRIYELTRIDSFLRQSGLVTQTDIRHFTTVNDNWAFAVNPFRQSGSFWYFRVKPGIGYSRILTDNNLNVPPTTAETTNLYPMISPVIGYEHYKPVNLRWQHNAGISLAYLHTAYHGQQKFIQGTSTTVIKNPVTEERVELYGFYGLGFFPNTRTQLMATAELIAGHSNFNDEYYAMPLLNLQTAYFLGYQSFLSAGLSVQYYYSYWLLAPTVRSTDKYLTTQAFVRFTHYIF